MKVPSMSIKIIKCMLVFSVVWKAIACVYLYTIYNIHNQRHCLCNFNWPWKLLSCLHASSPLEPLPSFLLQNNERLSHKIFIQLSLFGLNFRNWRHYIVRTNCLKHHVKSTKPWKITPRLKKTSWPWTTQNLLKLCEITNS